MAVDDSGLFVGIVSFGDEECDEKTEIPTVLVKISAYVDWIKKFL